LVSAIIPTRDRTDLLLRAVRSVLNQTYPNLEVVVVIDGPDAGSNGALNIISDKRLRVVTLDKRVGGSDARNKGVQHANGEWIAFLDDDDEWMPHKIQTQISAVSDSPHSFPLVCSQSIVRTDVGEFIWPEKIPRKPYSEYLFVRSRLTYGEGMMQTSALMVKRELAQRIPFQSGLPKNQDWDWVLRCTEMHDTPVIFLPTPLVIVHLDQDRPRITRQNMWRISLNWIRESRTFVTRRAYAAFLANFVASQAADEKAWKAFFILLCELLRHGSPGSRELFVFMGAWLLPKNVRGALRKFVYTRAGARRSREQNSSVN
jgi:glycosyltransferase involved in cell wall biosynthesis